MQMGLRFNSCRIALETQNQVQIRQTLRPQGPGGRNIAGILALSSLRKLARCAALPTTDLVDEFTGHLRLVSLKGLHLPHHTEIAQIVKSSSVYLHFEPKLEMICSRGRSVFSGLGRVLTWWGPFVEA